MYKKLSYFLFIFYFTSRTSTISWSCDRSAAAPCPSSSWMAPRSPTRPSSWRSWKRSSRRIWTHRCPRSSATFRTPWSRWSRTIWFGCCSGGAPSIPRICSRATRWTCRTLWEFGCRTACWTSFSRSRMRARWVWFVISCPSLFEGWLLKMRSLCFERWFLFFVFALHLYEPRCCAFKMVTKINREHVTYDPLAPPL